MKSTAKLFSILLLFSLTACFEEDQFPDTPRIEFEDIAFIDSFTGADSLKLTFNFEDGEANIGIIEEEDIFFPYNQYLVFLDENDSIITRSRVDDIEGQIYVAQLITRNISLGISGNQYVYSLNEDANHAVLAFEKQEYDQEISIDDFECPNIFNQETGGSNDEDGGFRLYSTSSEFGLDVYTLETNGGGPFLNGREHRINEDILVIPVNTYHNLFITIEKQNIDGEFEEFDFEEVIPTRGDCLFGNFNARIPWFSQDGESGKITHYLISRGFIAFQDNLIRIKFSVLDRNGNFSNEVITPTFRVSEITQ